MEKVLLLLITPIIIYAQTTSYIDTVTLKTGKTFSCNLIQITDRLILFDGNEESNGAPLSSINKIYLKELGLIFTENGAFKFNKDSLNILLQKRSINKDSKIWKSYYKKESNFVHRASIGFGLGIPYGMIGINTNLYLTDRLIITGGIGSIPEVDDRGYNIGLKLILSGVNNAYRTKLSVLYGTNAMVVSIKYTNETVHEIGKGLKIGPGFQYLLGEKKTFGIDVDSFYIVTSKFNENSDSLTNPEDDDIGRIAFSIGLSFLF